MEPVTYPAGRRLPKRGVFSADRVPAAREHYIRQILQEHPPNAEMAALLETIDFQTIRQLLAQHAQRSGIDAPTMNFVPREYIFDVGEQTSNSGAYIPYVNIILVPFGYLKKIAPVYETDVRSILIKTVLHEQIHASALVACEGGNPFTVKVQAGYSIAKDFRGGVYDGINEGVVEELTQRTLQEHADALGVKERKYHTYLGNRMFVWALMRKVARDVGVPEEVVWNGFVRGLYEGLNLDAEPELVRAFKNFIGSGGVKALRNKNDITTQEFELLTLQHMQKQLGELPKQSGVLQKIIAFFR